MQDPCELVAKNACLVVQRVTTLKDRDMRRRADSASRDKEKVKEPAGAEAAAGGAGLQGGGARPV